MDVPKIADDAGRREWMIQPRKGLLTSEFAEVMDITAAAIRAAIRRGKLPGVQLRLRGTVYAYAATVEDVANYYDLPVEIVSFLEGRIQQDVPRKLNWVGIPFIDHSGKIEIKTEFESRQEFEEANSL